MPAPGFSGLSKATTKTPVAAAPAAKAPTPTAKPAGSLLKQAQAEITSLPKPAPATKTRAQILREQAAAAEAEEAAATEAPAAEAVPETEAETQTRTVAPRASSGGFGLSVPKKDMANALLAFVQVSETKKVPSLFPTLVCSGGDQGGLWVSPSWQADEVAANLPQGKKPIRIFYLGYRLDVTIWPKEYNSANPGKDKPCNSGIIPCNDSELTVLATKALKNFQFTKKDAKLKFDLDASGQGAGRPNCSMEIIGYLPETDNLAVLRTAPGYGPVGRTMGNLARLIDPATGEIPSAPMTVKTDVESEANANQSQSWKTHYFDFVSDLTSSGKATWEAFEKFKASVAEDAEFMGKFNDWLTGADKPMTEDTVARLRLAASL